MAISNFIPEVWSAEVIEAFRSNFVFSQTVNRSWEGEIQNAGDTVRIQSPAAITVNDYAGTVAYETPTSTTQSLLIDQHKYWGFEVTDLNRIQANIDIRATYANEAGIALADAVDSNIAALYTAGTAGDVAVTLASDDMYDAVVDANKNLDDNSVPSVGRYLVVSPAGYASLLKNDKFIHATAQGDSVIRSGMVGMIAGMKVYKSVNTVLATTQKYVYGHVSAVTFAAQLLDTEALRLETKLSDGVRGQMVFGRKVVRPTALGTISATE